ncbi:hypothetical protein QJS10_CPA03g00967 [Acorus calamus]|uniref:Uncharacterized protein n=1 Tax=Acorus calamus TaxID=4465 RepID=A0AAV9F350_ACOCL|nr:hypothetical protein QJS10_CPA03g00967 [Acorus calamus]
MAVSKSFTVLLLLLCLLFSSPSSSIARPISGLNLALPRGQVEGSSSFSSSMERTPCKLDFSDESSKVVVVEKYYQATTLFNRLPRGRVPPSGPSKGINQNGQ